MSRLRKLLGKAEIVEEWTLAAGESVAALHWSPDGSALAAPTVAGRVVIADAATGSVRQDLEHEGGALSLAWSRDGRRLASGGMDGKARLWDPASGAAIAAVEAGAAWVEHVAWSRTGVLATAAGKHLRRFSADGKPLGSHAPAPSTISGLAWFPSSELLAVSCYGGVRLHEPEKVEPVRTYDWKGSMVCLRLGSDSKFVACGCQDSSLHVWHLKSGEDMQMSGYPGKVTVLGWSRAARFLGSGAGTEALLWDFGGKGPQGTKPRELKGHSATITDLAFREKDMVVATGAEDGTVFVWDALKPKAPLGAGDGRGAVTRLAWSPGDDRLASGSVPGSVVAWRMA